MHLGLHLVDPAIFWVYLKPANTWLLQFLTPSGSFEHARDIIKGKYRQMMQAPLIRITRSARYRPLAAVPRIAIITYPWHVNMSPHDTSTGGFEQFSNLIICWRCFVFSLQIISISVPYSLQSTAWTSKAMLAFYFCLTERLNRSNSAAFF